ncbi:MAG: lactoylglutathione lyase [Bacteroidetes bacterium]|nr:MAG: lactoylglutathione lyase [Bacteroidota bacterium]
MDASTNSINWFEVPTADIKRAKKFYESIFSCELHEMEMNDIKMAMFPNEMGNGKVNGALCEGSWYKPGGDGPLLYFNGNPNLQPVLDKVQKAGGKVILPKTEITPDIGFMAIFTDSEGNRVALHSQK